MHRIQQALLTGGVKSQCLSIVPASHEDQRQWLGCVGWVSPLPLEQQEEQQVPDRSVLAFLCELFLGETQLVCKILNRFKWLLRQSVYDLSKLSRTQEICAVDVNKINKVWMILIQ